MVFIPLLLVKTFITTDVLIGSGLDRLTLFMIYIFVLLRFNI